MNVLYLCDDSYAMIAGVSIYSLLEKNMDADEINLYLVADGISRENTEKLEKVVKDFGRKIYFLPKPDIRRLAGGRVETHWWIENVFSRVFLSEVLKDHPSVHRLIYIDCDTLIMGSLQDLWELNLQEHIGAGVCEAMGTLHKKAIGLSKGDNYFNAGVFLIDMDKWDQEEKDREAGQFIRKTKGKMEYADESVLNGILSREMLRISPKYNLTSLTVYFTAKELTIYRKSYVNYTEAERQDALRDARIIHFTSTYMDVRPWIKGCGHPYAGMWREYKEKTPWAKELLRKDSRKSSKKVASQCALILPRRIRIFMTGFLHAYVKPLRYLAY